MIEDAHRSEGWIVLELAFDPKNDPLAREKVKTLHNALVQFVEEGKPLNHLKQFASAVERHLEPLTKLDPKQKRLT
jgi:hypothetical protein